jgi:antitoxin ParD1/3/4
MPSSYAIGAELERFIKGLIKRGRYSSKSEVIRDGLRLLQDREAQREAKLDELRRAFREGIESGRHIPAEEVFDRLEAKYEKMAKERGM